MIKIICALVITLCYFSANAQFISLSGSQFGLGYTQIGNIKSFAYNKHALLQYEKNVFQDWSLVVGVGYTKSQFQSNKLNISIYSERYSINIPLKGKKVVFLNRNNAIYTEFGIVENFIYQEKNIGGDSTQIRFNLRNPRNLIGMMAAVGYRTNLKKNILIEIGFRSGKDYSLQNKKKEKIINTNNSIDLSLLKKLK